MTQLNTILLQNIEARLFAAPERRSRTPSTTISVVARAACELRDDAFERDPHALLAPS